MRAVSTSASKVLKQRLLNVHTGRRKNKMAFATIERIEARIEELEGEEQSQIRKLLKMENLEDFLIEELKAGNWAEVINILHREILKEAIRVQKNILTLNEKIVKGYSNYYALKSNIDEEIKSFARKVDATFDDFLNRENYEKVKNEFVERAMACESELFKQARGLV